MMNLAKVYRFTTLALLIAGACAIPNFLGYAWRELTLLAIVVNVVLTIVICALVAFNYLNRDNDKQWKSKILSNFFIGLFLTVGGLLQWM
ncbi:MAG: hypothetical protein AAFO04_24125 [Cyanobacteria bacterium J06592_8]